MTKFTKNTINFINEITLNQCHVPGFLLKHYAELGLNDKDCLRLMALMNAVPQGKTNLSVADLQNFLGCSLAEAEAIIAGFAKRGFISRVKSEQVENRYSLKNFYDEMLELWVFLQACPESKITPAENAQTEAQQNMTPDDIKQIYKMFEAEKGEPLSPTEIEKLNHWIIDDNWSAEMMKEALQRAVLHGTSHFAYIDKILLRWQKSGITQLSQLETEDGETKPQKKKAPKKTSKEKIMTNETDYNDIYKIFKL